MTDEADGGVQFESVPVTQEMVRAWEVANRGRWARRRPFRALDEALDVYGLLSLAAREVVRGWASAFMADAAYRRIFYVMPPFVPESVREFDHLLGFPGAMVRVWMPPSAGYLAIGGQVPTSSDDPADGERIAAQVYKTRLEVLALAMAGVRVEADTIWFPGERPHLRAPTARKLNATCPTCGTVLPATGICDYCA